MKKQRAAITQFTTVPDGRNYVFLFGLDLVGKLWSARLKLDDIAYLMSVDPEWHEIKSPAMNVKGASNAASAE